MTLYLDVRGNELVMEKPEIVFILAPPRSFTSVTCAMLGQHPQLYGVPELRLLAAGTVGEWMALCRRATYPMASGTLRAVGQLVFGEQTEDSVRMAHRWLKRHSHWSTSRLIRFMSGLVFPRIIVDKSPNIVYSPRNLRRTYRMFPRAFFIHLLRHPRGHAKSIIKLTKLIERRKGAPLPPSHWLMKLASFPSLPHDRRDGENVFDPQRAWYALNSNIHRFLRFVPAPRQMTIRGEDLLANPDLVLRHIANRVGLDSDSSAIEAMKHPEYSVYAGFGPKGASRGNDPFFLNNPMLRPGSCEPESLEGPLSWRRDHRGFSEEVRDLAIHFGYT